MRGKAATILVSLALVTALAAAGSAFYLRQRGSLLEEAVYERSRFIGQSLTAQLKRNILDFGLSLADAGDLTPQCEGLLQRADFLSYATVVDEAGALLCRSDILRELKGLETALSGFGRPERPFAGVVGIEGASYFQTGIPILDSRGEYRGALLLGVSTDVDSPSLQSDFREGTVMFKAMTTAGDLAQRVRKVFRFGLDLEDMDDLDDHCKSLVAASPGAVYAMVVNESGLVMHHSDPDTSGTPVDMVLLEKSPHPGTPQQKTVALDGRAVHQASLALFDNNDRYRGAVLVGFAAGK